MRPADAEWMSAWESAERPYPWRREQFKQAWVHEENNKPAGYVVVNIVEAEAYVQNIMVRRDLRRHGIGEKILKEAETLSLARGARYMVLDVDPLNKSAVSLYRKMGFELMEQRKKSYPRGEDALVMKKELS